MTITKTKITANKKIESAINALLIARENADIPKEKTTGTEIKTVVDTLKYVSDVFQDSDVMSYVQDKITVSGKISFIENSVDAIMYIHPERNRVTDRDMCVKCIDNMLDILDIDLNQ